MAQRNPLVVTLLFLLLTLGGGLLIGTVSMPDGWFAALQKPSFQPPNWLFGPVWSILYVLIGIAGARLYLKAPSSGALRLWWAQLVLNFLWSPAFFALHQPVLALLVVAALLVVLVALIGAALARDRISALLLVPYGLWVSFATLLNAAIVWLN